VGAVLAGKPIGKFDVGKIDKVASAEHTRWRSSAGEETSGELAGRRANPTLQRAQGVERV
jgi:hypothetical protein